MSTNDIRHVYLNMVRENCKCLIVGVTQTICLSELAVCYLPVKCPELGEEGIRATHRARSCHHWFTEAEFHKFLNTPSGKHLLWGNFTKESTYTHWVADMTGSIAAIRWSHAECYRAGFCWLICNSNKGKSLPINGITMPGMGIHKNTMAFDRLYWRSMQRRPNHIKVHPWAENSQRTTQNIWVEINRPHLKQLYHS